MKCYLQVLTLLLIISSASYAQDTIFTNKKDTILCTICDVSDGTIRFKKFGSQHDRKILIPFDMVNKYSYGPVDPVDIYIGKSSYPKIQAGFGYGLTYRLNGVDKSNGSEITDYQKDLRLGTSLNASASYFIYQYMGVGFKYSRAATSNSISGVTDKTFESLSEDIVSSYIGLALNIRVMPVSRVFYLNMTYSVGYLSYKDTGTVDGVNFEHKNSDIGYSVDVSGDIRVYKKLFAGIKVGAVIGYFEKDIEPDDPAIIVANLDDNKSVSMSRLDFAVCLRVFL